MQNTVTKASATPVRIGIPSDEEIYTSPEINRMIHIMGNRLMSTGLFPPWSREDEEETLKLRLLAEIQKCNYDPKKGDFNAFAGTIIRHLAGTRIYEEKMKAIRSGHSWKDDISLDAMVSSNSSKEEEDINDAVLAEEKKWSRRMQLVDGVLDKMPPIFRHIWDRLCQGASQRMVAAELGITFSMFRERYWNKLRIEFLIADAEQTDFAEDAEECN